MQMDEGLDTGDILLPGSLPIADDDTAGTLAEKLASLGGQLLAEALALLEKGESDGGETRGEQGYLCSSAGQGAGQDPVGDAGRTGSAVLSVALIPGRRPIAFWTRSGFVFFGHEDCPAVPMPSPEPWSASPRKELQIATGNGLLAVAEVQREGGRRMPVSAFLQGHPLAEGVVFG